MILQRFQLSAYLLSDFEVNVFLKTPLSPHQERGLAYGWATASEQEGAGEIPSPNVLLHLKESAVWTTQISVTALVTGAQAAGGQQHRNQCWKLKKMVVYVLYCQTVKLSSMVPWKIICHSPYSTPGCVWLSLLRKR